MILPDLLMIVTVSVSCILTTSESKISLETLLLD